MKTTFCILAGFLVLSVAPLRSAETNTTVSSVEREMLDMDRKLIDIRIKLLLAQYEKLEKQLMDLRFQEVLHVGEKRTEEETKQDKRAAVLPDILLSEKEMTIVRLRELARQRGELAARTESAKKQ